MAIRPIFIPKIDNSIGVEEINVDFKWHPGMAVIQKQKSISELHESGKSKGLNKILEVSSKSSIEEGVKLSAFNLMITTIIKHKTFSVEMAFQSSKVFERGGPFPDLLEKSSREAKKDLRIKNSGNLIKFLFFGKEFPISPRTYFYDWIYVNALNQNLDLVNRIMRYDAFTDIEFNPAKSVNCQAYSLAIFISLYKNKMLKKSISSPEVFLEVLKDEYRIRDKRIFIQRKLL